MLLRVGARYATNRTAMIARQEGSLAAAGALGGFLASELVKLPKAVRLAMLRRTQPDDHDAQPPLYSDAIVRAVAGLGRGLKPYRLDVEAFKAHVESYAYPRTYAGGSMDAGGAREQKLLEYFVSLDLLDVGPADVVIDVASEWSIFPDMVRRLLGVNVYQQDLIYAEGVHGYRIGGSAARMPVPDEFADKLVLHNAFEHFESRADIEFVSEAWRVLKPGGMLCILPLLVTERHTILSDPLVNRRGIVWDDQARVVQLPWWHNRFGRIYDASTLEGRVVGPGTDLGFVPTIYQVDNIHKVHERAYLHFALTMRKPDRTPGTEA